MSWETLAVYRINSVFVEDGVHPEGKRILRIWRGVWQIQKAQITKRETSQILQYEHKQMQIDLNENLNEGGHEWMPKE